MILTMILFVLGFIFVIKGADFLVEGASSIALKFKVSTLIIGLTVVAFGTSMPEFVVNFLAAFQGTGDVAIGNILGSNLFNLLFILGVTALIRYINVHHSTIWKEIPFSFLATLVLFVCASDSIIDNMASSTFSRSDGFVMLSFFLIFLYYVYEMIKKSRLQVENEDVEIKERKVWISIGLVLIGVFGLFLGGKWIVDGAVSIASRLGLSNFLISATIVAFGTSVPELVICIVAARKNHVDMAVGNIVGSNVFNIAYVLGASALIRPIEIPVDVTFDIIYLLLGTFLLFTFMFIGKKKHQLDKWQGAVFVGMYAVYLAFILWRGGVF